MKHTFLNRFLHLVSILAVSICVFIGSLGLVESVINYKQFGFSIDFSTGYLELLRDSVGVLLFFLGYLITSFFAQGWEQDSSKDEKGIQKSKCLIKPTIKVLHIVYSVFFFMFGVSFIDFLLLSRVSITLGPSWQEYFLAGVYTNVLVILCSFLVLWEPWTLAIPSKLRNSASFFALCRMAIAIFLVFLFFAFGSLHYYENSTMLTIILLVFLVLVLFGVKTILLAKNNHHQTIKGDR